MLSEGCRVKRTRWTAHSDIGFRELICRDKSNKKTRWTAHTVGFWAVTLEPCARTSPRPDSFLETPWSFAFTYVALSNRASASVKPTGAAAGGGPDLARGGGDDEVRGGAADGSPGRGTVRVPRGGVPRGARLHPRRPQGDCQRHRHDQDDAAH
eukprot:9501656-Pyramimonas_sp.AAC.2